MAMLTYRDFYEGTHTPAQRKLLYIPCCVRGCKRRLRLDKYVDEWPVADSWGSLTSLGREPDDPRPFVCPIHRLGLAEGRYYMTESFSGAEKAKKAEKLNRQLEMEIAALKKKLEEERDIVDRYRAMAQAHGYEGLP